MNIGQIKALPITRKYKKRIARGVGSGHGKTGGRGRKGYKARSGSTRRFGYEGGQMPLFRRLPKRGFNQAFGTDYSIVSLEQLDRFGSGDKVDPAKLLEAGVIKKLRSGVKVLGDGELTKALTVVAHAFSKSARQKIESVGGKAELIPPVRPPAKAPAKPRPKAAGKPAVEAKPKAEGKPKPAAQAKPKPAAEGKPKPSAEAKAEGKPQPAAEAKPEPKAEAKPPDGQTPESPAQK